MPELPSLYIANVAKSLIFYGMDYKDAIRALRRQYITAVLTACGGNQCKAAGQLGMHRNSLIRLAAELDINLKSFKKRRLACRIQPR